MAAQDELNQLERVFLRLGLAETDGELQNVISKFLPPVLLKLSSTQEGVRKKVMELLVHLNKRVKSRPKIQLPVETLLVQYQDPAALSFVTNFTIIYIKLGFPRLPLQAQCELAPTLVNAIGGRPPPQQDSLLQLLMPVLVHLRYPADAARRAALFNLAEKPRAAHARPFTFKAHHLNGTCSGTTRITASMACAVSAPVPPEPTDDFPAWLEAQGVNEEVARAMDSELGIRDYGVLRACVGDGLVRAELLAAARDRLPFGFYAVLRQVVKALRGDGHHHDDDAAASYPGDVTLGGLVDALLALFSGLSRELLLCARRLGDDGIYAAASPSDAGAPGAGDAGGLAEDGDERPCGESGRFGERRSRNGPRRLCAKRRFKDSSARIANTHLLLLLLTAAATILDSF
ncbi:unnamed protein product [Lampetra planeri]